MHMKSGGRRFTCLTEFLKQRNVVEIALGTIIASQAWDLTFILTSDSLEKKSLSSNTHTGRIPNGGGTR